MTTLTNSEGKALTYTNEFIETILLQLNSSNNYYTTGDNDIIFIKIGSSKVLILDYTYHINRNIFQNYTINENIINQFGLEFVLKNTSNEYTIQGVYTANSYIGTITELQDVYLALYDTNTNPNSYTGSENIDITDNQISLTFPLKINGETVLHPRNYTGAVFEMVSGTDNFSFRQNSIHGGAPIAIFNSSTKICQFFGNVEIPNYYDATSIDAMITGVYNDVYTKTQSDALFANYYNKTEIDAVDDELTSLILNTYTKTEVDNLLTNINLTGSENIDITNNTISLTYPLKISNEPYLNPRVNGYVEMYGGPMGISFLQHTSAGAQPIVTFNSINKSVDFFGNLNIPNVYNKAEVDTLISNIYTKTEVDTQLTNYTTLSYVMTNYASITLLSDNFYDKAYIDNQISGLVTTDYLNLKYTNSVDLSTNYYNKTEVDTQLTNYYTTTYLDDWITAELYVLENNFTNYYNKTETDNILASYHTGSYVDTNFYDKAETNNLLINLNTQQVIATRPDGVGGRYDYALQVINNTDWWEVMKIESTKAGDGCLVEYVLNGCSSNFVSGYLQNPCRFIIAYDHAGGPGLTVQNNGSATLSGSLTQNSDASLKDNVEDVELNDCMNMLENIHVKTYTRNDMEEGNKRIGFIAQDVKQNLPDKFDNIIGSNIITDKDTKENRDIMTMDYARMVCILWKIVQNQEQRIKALEVR